MVKKLLRALLLLSLCVASSDAHAGLPFGSFFNQNTASSAGAGVAHAQYNFATDGGAISTIVPAVNSTIPANAVIISVTVNVTTPVTAVGLATVSVGTNATGGSATSFLAATAKASLTSNALLNGLVTLAAPLKVTAAGQITVTPAVSALTAGVIEVWVQYYVAAN